jgi:hypothetical protein
MSKTLGIVNTVLGASLATYATWFLVQGPVLDGVMPPVWLLLVAVAGFLTGVTMLAHGTKRYLVARDSSERVTPPKGHI